MQAGIGLLAGLLTAVGVSSSRVQSSFESARESSQGWGAGSPSANEAGSAWPQIAVSRVLKSFGLALAR